MAGAGRCRRQRDRARERSAPRRRRTSHQVRRRGRIDDLGSGVRRRGQSGAACTRCRRQSGRPLLDDRSRIGLRRGRRKAIGGDRGSVMGPGRLRQRRRHPKRFRARDGHLARGRCLGRRRQLALPGTDPLVRPQVLGGRWNVAVGSRSGLRGHAIRRGLGRRGQPRGRGKRRPDDGQVQRRLGSGALGTGLGSAERLQRRARHRRERLRRRLCPGHGRLGPGHGVLPRVGRAEALGARALRRRGRLVRHRLRPGTGIRCGRQRRSRRLLTDAVAELRPRHIQVRRRNGSHALGAGLRRKL